LRDNEEFLPVIYPMTLPLCQLIIPKAVNLDQEKDWAGVSGKWTETYCFMDHHELLEDQD
jgi:hypothetical protein